VRVRFAHPISSSRTYSPSSEPSAIEPISMGLGLDTGQSIPHYMEQSLALQACSCGDPRCRPPRAQRLCTCGHAECPGAPTQLASTARDAMIAPPRTPEPPPRERERAHPGIGTRHMIVTITAAPWARPPPSAPAARA
jgi:hypothetical protein